MYTYFYVHKYVYLIIRIVIIIMIIIIILYSAKKPKKEYANYSGKSSGMRRGFPGRQLKSGLFPFVVYNNNMYIISYLSFANAGEEHNK
jgi:hypothetical protein